MLLMMRKALFGFFLMGVLIACGQEPNTGELIKSSQAESSSTVEPTTKNISNKSISNTKQSWKQIKQSGVIRALKLVWEEETSLPRSGSNSFYHIGLLNQFVAKHNLRIQWVPVKDLNQMFDYLAEHKADIIPRHLTITNSRLNSMDFTQPLLVSYF